VGTAGALAALAVASVQGPVRWLVIHCTRWIDSEGQTRKGCDIIAEQVDILAKAKEGSTEEPKKRRSK
jgi:hypothetical protein